MIRFALILALLFSMLPCAKGQWTLQSSPATADLRGIDNVGNGVAWASGTNGTILRTTNSGARWQLCTTPPDAEHLDFHGIQAFDATTAIAMSSGKGNASRLYQTSDGCQSWELIATNRAPEGFWDAIVLAHPAPPKTKGRIYILGDPVRGRFVLLQASTPLTSGQKLKGLRDGAPKARDGESALAASNSALQVGSVGAGFAFGTGGGRESHWYELGLDDYSGGIDWGTSMMFLGDVGDGSASSGMCSVAFRLPNHKPHRSHNFFKSNRVQPIGVAVGGNFEKPDEGDASAVYTKDGGHDWEEPLPEAMPHGYRSAVAYDAPTKTWITVGPNGTDISTDDGRNWRALTPAKGEPADADKNWNALSLPYVVGPHGRIGKLSPKALLP